MDVLSEHYGQYKVEFIIRPVKVEDAEAIHSIRTMHGVMETTMGFPSERVDKTQKILEGLTLDDHFMVAEINENGEKKVVGIVCLNVFKSPRARHSGSIGIMVHKNYQNRGIGKALMNAILDMADNWLMLVRVELGVYTDNEKAMKLYKSFGFEVEGVKKYAAIRNGNYQDECIMGRYNFNTGIKRK